MKETKNINIEVDISQDLTFYSGLERFNIVIYNRVSNAIKFQRPNNPIQYIKISGNCSSKSVVLRIRDNGIGIPEAYHEKVRFSSKETGPRIGFYVLKETLEKLKGTILLF